MSVKAMYPSPMVIRSNMSAKEKVEVMIENLTVESYKEEAKKGFQELRDAKIKELIKDSISLETWEKESKAIMKYLDKPPVHPSKLEAVYYQRKVTFDEEMELLEELKKQCGSEEHLQKLIETQQLYVDVLTKNLKKPSYEDKVHAEREYNIYFSVKNALADRWVILNAKYGRKIE